MRLALSTVPGLLKDFLYLSGLCGVVGSKGKKNKFEVAALILHFLLANIGQA